MKRVYHMSKRVTRNGYPQFRYYNVFLVTSTKRMEIKREEKEGNWGFANKL